MFPGFRSVPVPKAVPSPLVLILDQDEETRNAMRGLLHAAGYRTLLAASLFEATEIARGHSGLQLLVLNSLMTSGAPATQALGALRELAGDHLKAVLILDSLWSLPSHLRSDPLTRVRRGPVSPDALVAALEELRPLSRETRLVSSTSAGPQDAHNRRQRPLAVT